MKSKIINMVEKLSDAEDRLLESMFRSEPLADGGFSQKVVARIRRRLWISRLALPIAAVVGAAMAFEPAVELARAMPTLMNLIPSEAFATPLQFMPQVQFVVLGGLLLAAGMAFLNTLAE
ncbi:MAG: hypothetical protein V3S15_08690 [Woeseiaceae bacterium]